jgi:hypothetical protein
VPRHDAADKRSTLLRRDAEPLNVCGGLHTGA